MKNNPAARIKALARIALSFILTANAPAFCAGPTATTEMPTQGMPRRTSQAPLVFQPLTAQGLRSPLASASLALGGVSLAPDLKLGQNSQALRPIAGLAAQAVLPTPSIEPLAQEELLQENAPPADEPMAGQKVPGIGAMRVAASDISPNASPSKAATALAPSAERRSGWEKLRRALKNMSPFPARTDAADTPPRNLAQRVQRYLTRGEKTEPLSYEQLVAEPINWIKNRDGAFTAEGLHFLLNTVSKDSSLLIKELAREPALVDSLLSIIFHSLASVTTSPMPDNRHIRLAQSLSRQYAKLLQEVRLSPELPSRVRTKVGRILHRFLINDILIEEIQHWQKAFSTLNQLQADAEAAIQFFAQGNNQPPNAASGWNLQPTVLPEQRPKPSRERATWVTEASGPGPIHDTLSEISSLYETLRTSYNKAFEEGSNSDKTGRLYKALMDYVYGTVLPVLSYASNELEQRLEIFFRQFKESHGRRPRLPDILWIPNNRNLRLTRPEPGALILEAHFETDIQDQAAVKAIAASIEESWQGPLQVEGKIYQFRTRISIQILEPGASFSEGSLRITEGTLAVAFPDTIHLQRGSNYESPAHEFGHILGLQEDYWYWYDARQRTMMFSWDITSVMVNGVGAVHPRHLELAYRNLLQNPHQRPIPQ